MEIPWHGSGGKVTGLFHLQKKNSSVVTFVIAFDGRYILLPIRSMSTKACLLVCHWEGVDSFARTSHYPSEAFCCWNSFS